MQTRHVLRCGAMQGNPHARRAPPSIRLADLAAHIPMLKRAGTVNKGTSHRYLGFGGMIGYRNSYHHGGGQYIIYACEAGCPSMNPAKECQFVPYCYKLARANCRGRQASTFHEDTLARLRVRDEIDPGDVIQDVVVGAMVNQGMLHKPHHPRSNVLLVLVCDACWS